MRVGLEFTGLTDQGWLDCVVVKQGAEVVEFEWGAWEWEYRGGD